MALDIAPLLPDMLRAAREPLAAGWTEAEAFAVSELEKFRETLLMIGRLAAEGKISPERARLHVAFQRNSMQTVLLIVEGLGVLAVERAINAALGVARDFVNTTLGFVLL